MRERPDRSPSGSAGARAAPTRRVVAGPYAGGHRPWAAPSRSRMAVADPDAADLVAAGPGGARTYRLRARGAKRGRRPLDSVLILLGALLLVVGLGLFAYPRWAEWQHGLQRPAGPREELPERFEAALLGSASSKDSPSASTVALGLPAAPVGRPVWVLIPRIRVDSSVMEMGIEGGEYQVPSFDVGHHADSAKPGEVGNQIYNGHLDTIDAGKVFARLKELTFGDAVYVYTATHRFDWVVQDVRVVPNTERDFLRPTDDTRLTLYTCAGSLDLRTRDYSHRLVVTGRLVQTTPRVDEAAQSAPSTTERGRLGR